jgi:ubiquinone/menaquinone biosynthesis C-methylase UbiE
VDLGCGTGDISRLLAPFVEHVDAVDVSQEMIEAGKKAPGGDSRKLAWHLASAEEFHYRGPYGLAVAGESVHWF